MKAFIVLAFVACAAARGLDIDSLRLLKEKTLLKDTLLKEELLKDDLLTKEKITGHRFQLPKKTLLGESFPRTTVGEFESTYPRTTLGEYEITRPRTTVGEYETTFPTEYERSTSTWGQRRVTILSFEEIVSTSLFREYYNIPLFRQFLEQYPVVFRRYIESPLFQQFWTIPEFQQYFRNPIFFYKYIVPQVQIVAQTPEGSYYNKYETNYDNVDEYLNRNVYPERREVRVGDYFNKIFSGLNRYNDYTSSPIVPYTSRYGNSFGRNTYNNNEVNYKFLLDKIYRTLFVNKPVVGEVTEVRTDVKIAPPRKEVIVEPVTGESRVVVDAPRIVDVKVDQKIVPKTEIVNEIESEVVRKEYFLKKLLLAKRITPELYTFLMTLPYPKIMELVRVIPFETEETPYVPRRDIIGEYETPIRRNTFEDIETPFTTRQHESRMYGYKNEQLLNKIFNNDISRDQYVRVLRELLGQHQPTVRDVPTSFYDELVRA